MKNIITLSLFSVLILASCDTQSPAPADNSSAAYSGQSSSAAPVTNYTLQAVSTNTLIELVTLSAYSLTNQNIISNAEVSNLSRQTLISNISNLIINQLLTQQVSVLIDSGMELYSLTNWVSASLYLSTNAMLAGLGVPGQTLNPGFQATVPSYSIINTLVPAYKTLPLVLTLGHSNQTVQILSPASGYQTATNGTNLIQTASGSTSFDVIVTAEDGVTTKIYTVNFTRIADVTDTGSTEELHYCTIQFPYVITNQPGVSSDTIYGQMYHFGVTEAAGATAAEKMWLGYGPAGTSPATSREWVWTQCIWNNQAGNNDEFCATLQTPAAGTYSYTFACSKDNGASWTFADQDGSGAYAGLDFNFNNLGVWVVKP